MNYSLIGAGSLLGIAAGCALVKSSAAVLIGLALGSVAGAGTSYVLWKNKASKEAIIRGVLRCEVEPTTYASICSNRLGEMQVLQDAVEMDVLKSSNNN